MKILVIATSSQGGAGIAARRSFNALKGHGCDVTFFSLDQSESLPLVKGLRVKNFFYVAKRKLLTFCQHKFIQNSEELITSISTNLPANVKKYIRQNFDVIHIHAFYNILSVTSILELSQTSNKVVVTLHDQRFFTGGCHYARACRNFENSCSGCPKVRKIFQFIPEQTIKNSQIVSTPKSAIDFLSPSHWLAIEGRKSSVLSNSKIHVLSNPIPDIFFESESITSHKENLGKFQIGFIAQSIENPYKGFNTLRLALGALPLEVQRNMVLNIATSKIPRDLILPIEFRTFSPKNDQELVQFYKNISLLIVPSIQENSPSVIGEALAMSIPVVGANVGGIPELLNPFNQFTFEPGDTNELTRIILSFFEKGSAKVDRRLVRNMLSESIHAQKLIEIYEI